MNGHVFECHGETVRATQFQRTLQEMESYMALNMDYGDDIGYIPRYLKEFPIKKLMPKDPKANATKGERKLWEDELTLYSKRKAKYESNKVAGYLLAWGQCSKEMQAKLKQLPTFKEDIDESRDLLGLLKAIQGIAYKFEAQKYVPKEGYPVTLLLSYFAFRFEYKVNSSSHSFFANQNDIITH